jgi:ribosomal protein L7/L12
MPLESKFAEETVPFELHYCWTCYRQLVKAIASVNRFYAYFAIAGAEGVNRRKRLAAEAAESDVPACGVDPQKRVEIIKGLRIQFGLRLGKAKGYVDAAYAKFGKPFGVPANGQPMTSA